ncbi:inner membrane complex sub-compartment protein 1, putative [Babesia caballi]|uniref:Inner membrane complex sub-compartment protein 1, putative n=1 Tax=Babesia caballi TaxID=5871 RepID=A0AAV4M188_BABCB|nr:inner membrane complex sub-compartment protein 1, putative [Babesia caballi]
MASAFSLRGLLGIFNSCCAFDDSKPDRNEFELEEQHFRDRLRNSVNVMILLEVGRGCWVVKAVQDGTKLSCTLHVDCEQMLFRIACEDQVREMKFDAVKKLLHTREELSRVQTQGQSLNVNSSVALHLVENGNCIPLTFNNYHEKRLFLNIMRPYIQV